MTTLLLQPRRLDARRVVFALVALFIAFGIAWYRRLPRAAVPDTLHLDGQTMGTTYRVRVVLPGGIAAAALDSLADDIEARLSEINATMSAWDPDSVLSRFNAWERTEPFPVPEELAGLVSLALEIAQRSEGAFDPTVGPLVDLWGFGPAGRGDGPPDAETLAGARARVGHTLLAVEEGGLIKHRPDVRLDLGAIAKGYGVDAVALLIAGHGFSNYLVEIGGDLFAAGLNAQGKPWRIGVDRPALDALPGQEIHTVLPVRDAGVATSGDYRNYRRDEDGRVYAHILDPRIGMPVRAPVSSVTVRAPTAAKADALATALFVLGHEAGLAWLANAYPEADTLFLVAGTNGTLQEYATPGFNR